MDSTRDRETWNLPLMSRATLPLTLFLSPSGGLGDRNGSLSLGEGEGRGEGGALFTNYPL